jgi:hypothetical protein
VKEVNGDLWTYPAAVRCITTNGFVKKDGNAVMGRGCALEASRKWPHLSGVFGNAIKQFGNTCIWLSRCYNINNQWNESFELIAFPVKHQWYQKADINLIEQSALQLAEMVDGDYPNDEGNVIVIPRPGCGNGKLEWSDVRNVLAPILDDRFHIITKG